LSSRKAGWCAVTNFSIVGTSGCGAKGIKCRPTSLPSASGRAPLRQKPSPCEGVLRPSDRVGSDLHVGVHGHATAKEEIAGHHLPSRGPNMKQ
jgi:hypothetical protein